jgi:lipoprotein NlpI
VKKNNTKSNVGYTLFKSTGVNHNFPVVDLAKKRVTGTVSYNDKIYMTVLVDLNLDTVSVEGSVDELKEIAMDKESYIEMFKSQAEFFVANNISNPKKYYDEF